MPIRDRAERRAYQLQWLANRRNAFFANKVCVDCGSEEDLELDHIDPEIKVANSIWSWSKVRRDEETAKCEVRCRACHRIRTNQQMKDWFTKDLDELHGTLSGYLKRGCRCDSCKEFYRGWRREKYLRIGK